MNFQIAILFDGNVMKNLILLISIVVLSINATNLLSQVKFPGPPGKITNSLFDGNKIYVTTDKSVFKSTDYGENWNEINNGILSTSTDFYSSFASISKCRKDLFLFAQKGDVYKSTDEGLSWSHLVNVSLVRTSCSVADSNAVYFGGYYGYNRSSDGGLTWESFSSSDFGGHSINALKLHNGDLYIATQGGGIYRKTYKSNTYERIDTGITNKYINSIFLTDSTFYATTNWGVYKSTNKGKTWDSINTGLVLNPYISSYSIVESNNRIILSTDYDIYTSDKFNINWKPITRIFNYGVPCKLYSDSSFLYLTYKSGFYRSSDFGLTWKSRSSGINNTSVYNIFPVNDKLILSSSAGIFYSLDKGQNWDYLYNSPKPYIEGIICQTTIADTIFASISFIYDSGYLGRSSDAGNTWVYTNNTNVIGKVLSLTSLDSILFIGTAQNGVLISNDFGKTTYSTSIKTDSIYCICSHKGSVYALSFGQDFKAYPYPFRYNLYVSENLGGYWQRLELPAYTINSLTSNDDYLFLSTKDGLFRSSDNGQSWDLQALIGNNLYNSVVRNKTIISYTSTKIYISFNEGIDWQTVISSIGSNSSIRSLYFDDKYIYAGIGNIGVVIIPLPTKDGKLTLISPANEASKLPLNTILKWNSVNTADTYSLNVSEFKANNDSFFYNDIKDTTFVSPYIYHNRKYYWQVQAVNRGIGGLVSEEFTFTTDDVGAVTNLDNSEITVYPNPTANLITIKLSDLNLIPDFSLYNELGLKIENILVSRFDNEFKINLSNCTSGNYTLKIGQGDKIMYKTISVIK